MIVTPSAQNRLVTDTDWDGYLRFLNAVGERRIRVTYDGTMVELMTPSGRHEFLKSVLRSLLECLMEERESEYECGGNMTFKSALKKKGLEPDECYWVTSWEQVVGIWDDDDALPPPDLAIEVEVSASVLDRLSIYASLGVSELWRVSKSGVLTIWHLEGESYRQATDSRQLPNLPLKLLNQSLADAESLPQSRVVRAFRKALREPRQGT